LMKIYFQSSTSTARQETSLEHVDSSDSSDGSRGDHVRSTALHVRDGHVSNVGRGNGLTLDSGPGGKAALNSGGGEAEVAGKDILNAAADGSLLGSSRDGGTNDINKSLEVGSSISVVLSLSDDSDNHSETNQGLISVEILVDLILSDSTRVDQSNSISHLMSDWGIVIDNGGRNGSIATGDHGT